MSAPPLVLEDVRVTAGGRPILQIHRLSAEPGEMLGILGPNGAGKTTLLRTCAGFCRPREGKVSVLGRELTGLGRAELTRTRRRIGYVPQLHAVPGAMPITIREVVAIGRTGIRGLFRRLRREDWAVVDAWIERLELREIAGSLYGEASGGQQRKALIARALAQEPALLLLDEPAAHLDIGAREQIVRTLQSLHSGHRLTTLVVCHEVEVLPPACRRVVLLDRGRIRASGDCEQVLNSQCIEALYGPGFSVLHVDGRHGIVPSGGGGS